MFYRCKSCGGNVTYNPDKKKMICESCGNEGEPELISQDKKHVCNNCGAEIEADQIDLSLKCPYCGTYVIFEDRMENEYEPNLVLPFAIDKHKALDLLKEKFAKQMFLPGNFCSSSTIESMEGLYVPFWMYDLHTHVHFEGEADKIRTWEEGDYDCTETSTYRIVRDFDVDYDKIPVDASKAMPDAMMDLVEPYKYEALGEFDAKFLSGFQAEIYDEDKDTLFPRAKKKRPARRRKHKQDATTKGVVFSITRPAEKGKGFPHEQHRNSEQGQRASRTAPHGRRIDCRNREHSGCDQGAHDCH